MPRMCLQCNHSSASQYDDQSISLFKHGQAIKVFEFSLINFLFSGDIQSLKTFRPCTT